MKNKLTLQVKKYVSKIALIVEIILSIFGLYGTTSFFQNNQKNIVYAQVFDCNQTWRLAENCKPDNRCYWTWEGCHNKREVGVACEGHNDWCTTGICDGSENGDTSGNCITFCSAGTYKCDNNNLNVCKSDGSAWSLSKKCAANETCNASTKTCDQKNVDDTYIPPENDDGDTYGNDGIKKSGFIPDYPESNTRGIINFKDTSLSIGKILSKLLPYIYVIAGLILLVMLIFGGIGLMTSVGNPDKTKAASGRITTAIIGFFIVFISYFVAKIVEIILGVKFM